MRAIPPHMLRVINELTEMTDRLSSLAAIMKSPLAKTLPMDEAELMARQAEGMVIYVNALSARLDLLRIKRSSQ